MISTTLYHGSLQVVEHPLVNVERKDLDFGQGFYMTDILQQARNWSLTLKSRRVFQEEAVVNVYRFDKVAFEKADYKTLTFKEYDLDWLEFICKSRRGEKPWKGYDYIEGGVANDSVIDTVEAYMPGIMDATTALGRLIFHSPNNQICILNQEIADRFLAFEKSIKVE